jgi:hypothetical protein
MSLLFIIVQFFGGPPAAMLGKIWQPWAICHDGHGIRIAVYFRPGAMCWLVREHIVLLPKRHKSLGIGYIASRSLRDKSPYFF